MGFCEFSHVQRVQGGQDCIKNLILSTCSISSPLSAMWYLKIRFFRKMNAIQFVLLNYKDGFYISSCYLSFFFISETSVSSKSDVKRTLDTLARSLTQIKNDKGHKMVPVAYHRKSSVEINYDLRMTQCKTFQIIHHSSIFYPIFIKCRQSISWFTVSKLYLNTKIPPPPPPPKKKKKKTIFPSLIDDAMLCGNTIRTISVPCFSRNPNGYSNNSWCLLIKDNNL